MHQTKSEAVRAVIQAIRAKDTDHATKNVHRDFLQHSPFMAAGLVGFKQWVVESTLDDLQLHIVRMIEDGAYVVAQLKAESNGDDIFAVYRFEDGSIIEHWAFTAPNAPPNKSSHTQVDGPLAPQHLEDTEINKEFARRYYQTFHLAGNRTHNEEFFTGDLMIRHEPGVRDGLAEFLSDVETLMQHRTIDEIKLLLGQGDLIFIAAKGSHEGKPCVYIDLYRVDNMKIVEHWGFPEMVPSQTQVRNSHAML